MNHILVITAYAVGAGELLLALYFWKTNFKDGLRRVTGFLSAFAGIWVILNGMTAFRADGPDIHALVTTLFVFSLYLVTLFVHFSILFPLKSFAFDRLHTLLFYLPATVLALVTVMSNEIVKGYVLDQSTAGYIIPGTLYPLFSGYVEITIILALLILFRKAAHHGGYLRTRIFFVAASFCFPAIVVLADTFLFESRGANYNSLVAPLLTCVWLGVTSYIVLKR